MNGVSCRSVSWGDAHGSPQTARFGASSGELSALAFSLSSVITCTIKMLDSDIHQANNDYLYYPNLLCEHRLARGRAGDGAEEDDDGRPVLDAEHLHLHAHTLVLLSHSMQVFYICIYGFFYLENFRVLFFTHNKVSFAEIH